VLTLTPTLSLTLALTLSLTLNPNPTNLKLQARDYTRSPAVAEGPRDTLRKLKS